MTYHLEQLREVRSFRGSVSFDEPMARHTTLRVGGPAAAYVRANSLSSLKLAIDACQDDGLGWFVVGSGSNLLVSDEGFAGAVIALGGQFAACTYDASAHAFTAGAACKLSHLVQEALREDVSGFEFAVGTPGTIGGAVRMNAGTRREYLAARLQSLCTLHPGHGLKRYDVSDLQWGYRESSLPYDEVVLEATFAGKPGEHAEIAHRMETAMSRRRKTQPLEFPSCGSVFRNPEQDSVGRMVEVVGLKGASCGGAQISVRHANFIVNRGDARAADIVALMHAMQDAVQDHFGITLVPEVRFLGFAQ